MIAGIFHQGSGLGNQLFRYIATRIKALDLGVDFGMIYPQQFKGVSFMNLDMGCEVPDYGLNHFEEKKVVENGVDIRGYDPEFNFIEDNTIIDGEFQDERYFGHRMKEIDEWLKVELLDMPDNLCIIGYRGGEYTLYPDLFLTKEYWDKGMKAMRDINPDMKFVIHTDDKETAKQFFGGKYPIVQDIEMNWRSVRFAKYAIIANSSFYILPRLLNGGITIAPRFWARRNTRVWALPQNFYKSFLYI